MTGNPELGLKDTCDGLPWRYKILSLSFTSHADGAKSASSDTFCGSVAGRAIHGITDFQGGTSTPEFDPDNQIKLGYGGTLTGDIGLRAPASFAYTLTGCDDDKQYCATSFTRPVLGDGLWSFGFSVEAASRTAKDAELTWVLANPSVGFVDYGPDGVQRLRDLEGHGARGPDNRPCRSRRSRTPRRSRSGSRATRRGRATSPARPRSSPTTGRTR